MVPGALVLVLTLVALSFFSSRSGLVAKTEAEAAVLAQALAAPVAFNDLGEIRNTLDWWKGVSELRRVVVRDTHNRVLAVLPEAKGDTNELVAAEGTSVDWGGVRLVRSISHKGEPIGNLTLEASFAGLYRQAALLALFMLVLAGVGLVLAGIAIRRLARWVSEPLSRLADVAGSVAHSQDFSWRAEENGPIEVAELSVAFNYMLERLQHKAQVLDQELRERARSEVRLDRLAHYDQVTGLANRVQFQKELPRAAERAHRLETNFALVFLDLDDFKVVNDTLGHDIGDRLLASVGERLAGSVRKGDLVCRLGGDEFTVILENISSLRTAVEVVAKLIETLSSGYVIDGHNLHVGVSAGIALYPAQTGNLSDLVRFADIAMYQAKGAGKNDYCVYTSEMISRANDRLSIESDLRRGLDADEFFLVYQPQVNVRDGTIEGIEALVRWQHPTRGVVTPGYFIDIAEESGLIVPLGRQVIAKACQQWRTWREQGLEPPRLGINVSARQLNQESFADDLINALIACGPERPMLELEITESLLMSDTRVSKAMLHRLAAAGIEWSLDDFGTGYSSLTYLAKFPVKNIKIDRSFVARLPGDESSEAIVMAIVAMARGLSMRVICEGVETREQVDYLSKMGDVIAQGYYFHRPLKAEDITVLLRSHACYEPLHPGEIASVESGLA